MNTNKAPLSVGSGRAILEIKDHLSRFVIGQERAKKHIARMLIRARVGLRDKRHPAGALFLLGPTGVGKTELVKATADYLFGNLNGYTHVSCGNFQNGHEVSRILGSPPGYVGHDIEPEFSQAKIDAPDRIYCEARDAEIKKRIKTLSEEIGSASPERRQEIVKAIKALQAPLSKVIKDTGFSSIVLFDEMEKAHPDLHKVSLDMLGEGRVHLNNNHVTDVTNSYIVFTSNIASRDISKIISGSRFGFQAKESEETSNEDLVYRAAMSQVERILPPELIGRIGKENFVVCNQLSYEEMLDVLDLHFGNFLARIAESDKKFELIMTDAVRDHLVGEARDRVNIALGARALLNVLKKRIEDPVNLLMIKDHDEDGIEAGDRVLAEMNEEGKVHFVRLGSDGKLSAGT